MPKEPKVKADITCFSGCLSIPLKSQFPLLVIFQILFGPDFPVVEELVVVGGGRECGHGGDCNKNKTAQITEPFSGMIDCFGLKGTLNIT